MDLDEQVRKEDWESLTPQEQEEILSRHFNHPLDGVKRQIKAGLIKPWNLEENADPEDDRHDLYGDDQFCEKEFSIYT